MRSGQLDGLRRGVEGDLDDAALAARASRARRGRARRPSASSAAASGLRRSGWMTVGLRRLGAGRSSASRARALGLAHRPGAVAGRAREALAAGGVVLAEQDRAAVALGELAGLEQLEHLVGQLEQADQVRDRDAAAADAPADLLLA